MRGFDVVLSIGTKVVAGQINASLDRGAEQNEITDRIQMGWREYLTGCRYWSVKCDGAYVADDEGYLLLESAFNAGDKVTIALSNDTVKYSGQAIITNFPVGASFNKDCTYNITLLGSGELVRV